VKVKLIECTPNPDKVVAVAAKLCYSPVGVEDIEKGLTNKKIDKFVNTLVNMGHESPIEHVNFTFAIEGISRACSHQIVRHRIASFSQQSQRYVTLDHFEYIIPPEIEAIPKAKELFIESMVKDQEVYNELTEILLDDKIRKYLKSKGQRFEKELNLKEEFKKVAPKKYEAFLKKSIEDARYKFPNACETKMVVTMNARSLFNFFKHRCCKRAQWEIQEVANAMLGEVKTVAPIIFKNAGATCDITGRCPEGAMSCKRYLQLKKGK